MLPGSKQEFYTPETPQSAAYKNLETGNPFFMRLLFWICLLGVGMLSLLSPDTMDDLDGQ
jgi:hypothetical protein